MNPLVRDKAILLRLTEPSTVVSQASEGTRKWNETEVEIVQSNDSSRFGMADSDGVAPILGVTEKVKEVRVRRRGPDATPILWHVVKQPGPIEFKPGTEVRIEITARLRHSVWVSGSSMFSDKGAVRQDIINQLKGQIDDLSMLETIFISTADPSKVVFDRRFLRGFTDSATKAQKCRELIDACHKAGIQLLCGYEGVAEGKTNSKEAEFFKEFLRKRSLKDIEDHARAIHQFVFTEQKLDFDGVGFDIETLGVDRFDQEFESLYGTLADLLAEDNRILTFAAGAFAKDGETDPNASHMRSQKYRLAKLAPNIIVRPMGYDGGNVFSKTTKTGLHVDLIRCALQDVGLHPSQVQMGVKIIGQLQVGERDVVKDGKPAKEPIFQKVGISDPFSPDEVHFRIEEIYRPNRIGLICFALGGGSVPSSQAMRDGIVTYDAVLNPDKIPPGTSGTPLQCPRRVKDGR